MDAVYENTMLDIINDFEKFIDKLPMRKDELKELKDELLIYNDPAFMKSIKTGIKESEEGTVVKCKDMDEVKNLFKSL
uniref:Uncharacterized protein n=1 Tax=Candidatus Methanogaster sp. ANME-2c ERB4 TaxID=2759911 RepID=A0A7G9YAD0_9EURY|nr:hypothetical protein OHNFDOKE_00005 [Methanosarcinales archaeon ANME-2c ERB4]QNO44964.1 hypothetical protein ABJGDBBG_00002 [Methanosarcinales archaeon ANME-2c ERB4]QNO45009.1 hypothetical protein BPECEDMP_00005 [Methanosarcinales archaeon ANME-2c ERB4]